MSRQGPFGFGFSMLIEIAAIVVIVSLLPRFDLRPSASAAANPPPRVQNDFEISPIGWTELKPQISSDARPTSYDQPRPATPSSSAPESGSFTTREAPPLIEFEADRPQYVERQLDRASQQLVNGVGTAVSDAAHHWLRPIAPVNPQAYQRSRMTQQQSQHRPWIRY